MANIYDGILTLDDNWGDVKGNGEFAASGDQIQNLVRTELKARVGYLHCVSENTLNNILYGFMNKESYEQWVNDGSPSESKLILSKTNVSKGIPEPYYDVKLVSMHTSNKYISLDGKINIPIRFTYTYNEFDPNNGELSITNQIGQGNLVVQARTNSIVEWVNAEQMTQKINPSSYMDLNPTTEIDMTNFIPRNGSWEVRMAVSVDTGTETIQSSWVYLTVVKTNIDITLTNSWETPQLTPELISRNQPLNLQFTCLGEGVDKWLNIEITGAGGSDPLKRLNITKITDNQFTYQLRKSNELYNIYAHGIHNITYWIEIDKNPEFATPKKTAQIMVVADNDDKTPYILFNNINGTTTPLTNWTREHIFDYAFYLPDGNRGSLRNVPIKLSFTNADGVLQLMEEKEVNVGEKYSLDVDLSLELTSSESTLFVYCESERLGWKPKPGTDDPLIYLYISNTGDYAPSGGAEFVFNPRIRTNDEPIENLKKIYNTANAETIELNPELVKWTGVNFNNTDGWITDPINGRCLRLLDKQQLTIPYQPLKVNSLGSFVNTTIELSFAVKNIINDQIPLISICDKYVDDENNLTVNGFELNASDAYFLPNVIKTREILDAHDVVFAENEKIHMAICINQEYTAGNSADATKLIGTIPDAPGQAPYSVSLNTNVRFIRIYINGVLSRVVKFDSENIYDDNSLTRYIQLGNNTDEAGADLDIYEMKVFHTSSPKKNYEILKDYIASLSSSDEKDKIIFRNNILAKDENNSNVIRNGVINYDECNKYYNTLLWMPGTKSTDGFARLNGREYGDEDKKSNPYRVGNLKINYLLKDANDNIIRDEFGMPRIDENKSGVLYNMSSEGQGTTAMLYFKWNQRYRFDVFDEDTDNEFVPYFQSIKDSSTGTITSEGYYDMFPNDPIIKRLDGKVNWASSMQSHKMGATALYHDLWKGVVGNSGITELSSVAAFDKIDLEKTGSKETTSEKAFAAACKFTGRNNGYGSCRVAVHQDPFLLFTQPTEKDEPMFYGMITFGAAKGDKPTFGYNSKFNKHFVMIEGTDNDRPLISCNLPWDDYHFTQAFDDDEVDGGIMYHVNGGLQEQFEISMGDASTEAIGEHWDGSNPCLRMFKDMINFCYLHNPNLIMYTGTYEDLVADKEANSDNFDPYSFYWVNKDSATDALPPIMSADDAGPSKRFDVYRWNLNDKDNNKKGAWVPAGLYKSDNADGSNGYYERLNLLTQFGYENASHSDIKNLQASQLNNFFINKRAARFKTGYKSMNNHAYNYHIDYPNGIEDFVHKNDILFTLQFLKFVAGTDNWSKNTYIYNTGIYYKKNPNGTYMGGSAKYEGLDKFRFFQDDLDTIFEIDNYGSKTKPYYVEEHDYLIKSGKKDPYWNSDYNGMYKLVELAYNSSDNTELKSMMNNILSEMNALGGSPTKCLDKYFQGKCENAFPEVVYNTTAEQFYMDGYYRGSERANDRYSFFLSQCLGSQKSAETDWQQKRVNYMSSYAQYGVFAGGTSGTGIAFKPDGNMDFELVPHIWMYPIASEGSSNYTASESFEEAFNVPGRVPAGQKFTISIDSNAGSENQVTLKGYDFYRDFGNLARVRPFSSFDINGKRLSKLTIVGNDENKGILFNPTTFGTSGASNVDNIREINVSGKLGQGIDSIFNMEQSDLSKLWRLSYLNLSATSIKKVILAPNSNIETLILPKVTQHLILDDQTKLSSLNLNNSYKSLKSIVITKPSEYVKEQTLDILRNCMNANAQLTKLELTGINWQLTKDDLDLLNYIVTIDDVYLEGNIYINYAINFDTKYKLLKKFGNIDDKNNYLYIDYTDVELGMIIRIKGETYVYKKGQYVYNLKATGNEFVGFDWNIDDETYATISNDGVLTLKNDIMDDGTTGQRIATITCTILKNDNNHKIVTKKIYFEEKIPEIGDVVYADGTCSSPNEINPNKTVIGKCFYINPEDRTDRRMVALRDITIPIGTTTQTTFRMGLDSQSDPGKGTEIVTIAIANISTISKPHDHGEGYIRLTDIKNAAEENFKEYSDTLALGDIGTFTLTNPLLTRDPENFNFAPEFPVGTKMPIGKFKTLTIINHRNHKVIIPMNIDEKMVEEQALKIPGLSSNFVEEKIDDKTGEIYNPETKETIAELARFSHLENQSYYYPAPTLCYVYEPEVKPGEILDKKFKRHNWYLPTFAEGARLYYYENKPNNDTTCPKFETDNTYTVATNSTIWTSTISANGHAWAVRPTSNDYIFIYPNQEVGLMGLNEYRVRPVCSF